MAAPAKIGFQTLLGFVGDVHKIVEDGKKAIASTNITDNTATPIKSGLAMSQGDLTKKTFDRLEQDTQIMLAGALRGLADVKGLTYEDVLSDLMNNTLLEPTEGGTATRADKYMKTDKDWMKWDGKSLDSINVNEVKSWFVRLIRDKEIMEDIKLDLDFFGKVVDYAKKTVDLFEFSVNTKQYHEAEIVDIAVLRYPDPEHPYLMLYQIRLKAFRDGSRDGFTQVDTNGLSGEFHSVKFSPRTSIINSLADATKTKAAEMGREFVI